ncbi:MAG: NAD(P)-binding protein [Oligoflexia bacterium]|nr:NAD(P)-binding protein [Oligoflexia bacterium]
MNPIKEVKIIGAGASGLFAAYWIKKYRPEISVTVYEQSAIPGGLIGTIETPHGLAERAANGLIFTKQMEDLARQIGVGLLAPKATAKKRYFFWNSTPRRWPLDICETFYAFMKFVFNFSKRKPRTDETVWQWGLRLFGEKMTERVIGTALLGIYSGDPKVMSASLIFGRFFEPKVKNEKYRGTVSPSLGMGELIASLVIWLKKHGVDFKFGEPVTLPEWSRERPLIVCTSAYQASGLMGLGSSAGSEIAELSNLLKQVEVLPIVTATAYFEPGPDLSGFGCLFSRNQGVRALGVLFNSDIWDNRSQLRSETWIFGGAFDREITKAGDAEIVEMLLKDRTTLNKSPSAQPKHVEITRRDRAIPHYDLNLERILRNLPLSNLEKHGLFINGNYLGQIGLSRILERSEQLVQRMING